MITILKLLQNVARVRSRTLGEAELEVVWLLTAATFVAVGVQLISLTLAVNIGRILNSKDDIRAVRHVPHRGSSPKRTPPPAATVTYHSPAVSFFQKTVVQTGARITRVVGPRKGRRQDDPLLLATT